ncbi:hypothetical protein BAUCODRAFT_35884 [Baudoinia panamericana UAMH 10762]|uniref:Uncharacterized protein n=1 Tax=Baudoinia panamericana (strain UAMH 10762) TaxID=717646 RepID=M2N782_BAUPA|nr:uncharacterized protein BAUCODRAFT_35884 [Baudoinia panamericana UAMH 10762]EMC94650.1 hypothetical protein BAUCODRAFT_35884 [Baudoinia panamericana UAMH 10762]
MRLFLRNTTPDLWHNSTTVPSSAKCGIVTPAPTLLAALCLLPRGENIASPLRLSCHQRFVSAHLVHGEPFQDAVAASKLSTRARRSSHTTSFKARLWRQPFRLERCDVPSTSQLEHGRGDNLPTQSAPISTLLLKSVSEHNFAEDPLMQNAATLA